VGPISGRSYANYFPNQELAALGAGRRYGLVSCLSEEQQDQHAPWNNELGAFSAAAKPSTRIDQNSQDIFSPIETFRWGFMGTAYPNRVEDFVILPYIRIGVEILSGSRRNASSII